jgi:hypothetical protein
MVLMHDVVQSPFYLVISVPFEQKQMSLRGQEGSDRAQESDRIWFQT